MAEVIKLSEKEILKQIVQDENYKPNVEEAVYLVTMVRMFIATGTSGMIETVIKDDMLVCRQMERFGGGGGTARMKLDQLIAFCVKRGHPGLVARELCLKMGLPFLYN